MPKGNKKIVISATEQVRVLWEVGFFKGIKSFRQIDERLSEIGYNFTSAELGKALQRASYLTRRGKRGAYKYAQKGPHKKP